MDSNKTKESKFDVRRLIAEERVVIYYQPIVSTYQNRISGVEALARGVDEQGKLIPPLDLFAAAAQEGMSVELDRLCQRRAMLNFSKRPDSYKDLILFLNVDNSVIHLDRNISAINDYAIEAGLTKGNIVLEINELHTADMTAVQDFVNKYRKFGFMISIDDIGAGYSNLDRVILLEPDVIKIDRELIRNIQNEYYKQQVVEMIIRLSEKTGAIVVSEGVEELNEILTVLQFGTHMLQGFYIAKPMDMATQSFKELDAVISQIAQAQKEHISNHLTGKIHFNRRLRGVFQRFRDCIANNHTEGLGEVLKHALKSFTQVECAYIIDQNGNQMTDTVFNDALNEINIKSLFTPFRKGDEAKLKAYYYVLKTTNQPMYISDDYLSLASGHKCITVSGWIDMGDSKNILCLDLLSVDI